MILPTLFIAIHIAYNSRKDVQELFHNVAVCFWIGANSSWMVNEFFFEDLHRGYAKVFFALGMLTVIIYYMFLHRRQAKT